MTAATADTCGGGPLASPACACQPTPTARRRTPAVSGGEKAGAFSPSAPLLGSALALLLQTSNEKELLSIPESPPFPHWKQFLERHKRSIVCCLKSLREPATNAVRRLLDHQSPSESQKRHHDSHALEVAVACWQKHGRCLAGDC
jgi:hypothetical protein